MLLDHYIYNIKSVTLLKFYGDGINKIGVDPTCTWDQNIILDETHCLCNRSGLCPKIPSLL